MAYHSDETVIIETSLGQHELELELEVDWQLAEPDVGIMADYIDEITVTAVNGSTRHAKWVDKIISRSEKLTRQLDHLIYNNQ